MFLGQDDYKMRHLGSITNTVSITCSSIKNACTDVRSKIQVSSIIYLQRQLNSNHYSLSGDLKYVLLEYSRFRLYRHSFTAQYSIYSLDKSSYSPLSLSGDVDIADRLQMASWSPSGHALAVVRDNDLYYLSDISAPPERLTNSGRKGLIFNGIADWLYEGETKL